MNNQNPNLTVLRRELGVTLIELMISLVLAMLLTAGIIKVFVGNHTTFEFNQGLARIQENARFALDHIAYNARMAGYHGCISDIKVYNNLAGGANLFRDDIGNGLQGYDSDGNGSGTGIGDSYAAAAIDPNPSDADSDDWTPQLPTELEDLVMPGSDVLVVRAISGNSEPLVSPFTDSAQLFAGDSHGFENGDILVVSDCQKASIFQLTNVKDTGFGINLVHSNASFTPGNAISNWDAVQNYGLGAEVAQLRAFAFFVGRNDNGRPSLYQLRLQTVGGASKFEAEELVEGIDTMQVRYGEDTDHDGGIDAWESAAEVADWTSVLSVEVTLLARSPDEYGTEKDEAIYNVGGVQFDPVDDRRLRQIFATTIGVRNRLP